MRVSYLNGVRVAGLSEDLQQNRIGDKEESWKQQSLLFQIPSNESRASYRVIPLWVFVCVCASLCGPIREQQAPAGISLWPLGCLGRIKVPETGTWEQGHLSFICHRLPSHREPSYEPVPQCWALRGLNLGWNYFENGTEDI